MAGRAGCIVDRRFRSGSLGLSGIVVWRERRWFACVVAPRVPRNSLVVYTRTPLYLHNNNIAVSGGIEGGGEKKRSGVILSIFITANRIVWTVSSSRCPRPFVHPVWQHPRRRSLIIDSLACPAYTRHDSVAEKLLTDSRYHRWPELNNNNNTLPAEIRFG